ncbi:response regulator transcription factor [Streptomyces sp. Qhu-G9]|uniref:response regulator transcription factor n=1 Tax=Streptomyces sp. Qhu-G9 TaxID=3452799 RepID=UPI0022AC58A4|nr:response regulator transcription factor [Streptomyces aurantiacus]WAU78676.1 response regulator transcription factor [Streptomyces aurantiacus]
MTAPVSAAPAHLLVVDDEEGARGELTTAMEFLGFRVTAAATGHQALEALSHHRPDLVLLDVGLPGLDGFDVCRTLRTRGHTMPVMFLAGRDDVDEGVRGLDLGGDDFVTRPFELKEVAARIRALLRRTADRSAEHRTLRAGDVLLDAVTYEVWSGGTPVRLTTTEFALLRYLMENPGRVLTRAQIQERVWNHRAEGPGSVDTYVYYLRRKLGTPGRTLIRTVRGAGYLLRAD